MVNVATWVTRWACERITQNVAQPLFDASPLQWKKYIALKSGLLLYFSKKKLPEVNDLSMGEKFAKSGHPGSNSSLTVAGRLSCIDWHALPFPDAHSTWRFVEPICQHPEYRQNLQSTWTSNRSLEQRANSRIACRRQLDRYRTRSQLFLTHGTGARLPDSSRSKYTKTGKYTEWPQTLPNGHSLCIRNGCKYSKFS
jgi:hypothetical protein